MKHRGIVLALTVALTGSLLAGCTGNNEELTGRVGQLETEVSQLKAQLAELQTAKSTVSVTTAEASSGSNAAPVVVSDRYTDLDILPDPKLKTWINQLNALSVFSKTTGEFKPFDPVTRAEYVTWVFKAYNAMHPKTKIRMAPQADPYFSDLPKDHPAYPYAQALAEAGYSVGYEDGTFRPEQALTREEMLGIKLPVDNGGDVDGFMWGNFKGRFSDNEDLHNTRFVKHVHADLHHVDEPYGSNITRAFGNIKTFKRKEPVRRFEAAATVWQTGFRGKYTAEKTLADMKADIQ